MEDEDGPRASTRTGSRRRRFDRNNNAVERNVGKVSVNEDVLAILFEDALM